MEARADGTTSLSKTSVEKVVVAALLDGLLVSPCGPGGSKLDMNQLISFASVSLSSDLLSVLVLFVFWKTTTTYSALHSAIALASHVATSLHQTNAFQEGNN